MSPEFRSLLMKEWAERRSMFWFGLVLMLAFLGYCVAYEFEYRTRALIASYYSTCTLTITLAAVLLAMSTATGEYSRKTLSFSASLPVSLSQVAWARLLGAWLCLVIPILCGAVVVTLLVAAGVFEQAGLRWDFIEGLPDRPSISRFAAIGFLWTSMAIAVVYTLHLSTVLSLIGTCCRSEGTAGFLGVIFALCSMVVTGARVTLDSAEWYSAEWYFLSDWIGALLPVSLAINWGYGERDGSSYTDLDLAPLIFGPLAVNLLLTAALATWFARRYGRRAERITQPTNSKRRWLPRIRVPDLAARLGIRWPGRFAALTWLNARQSVPLCLVGLLIAILITLTGLHENPHVGTVADRLAGRLPSSTWFIGVLWGAVVAVGIFASELQPGLEHFWRTRPISPGKWFWMKFSVGLLAVVGTLDLLPALLAWGPQRDQPLNVDATSKLAYLACMPLVHAEVYAVAVAAVCRLRRPIPAAIFALVFFFVIDSVLKSFPGHEHLSTIDVHNKLAQAKGGGSGVDLFSSGYLFVYSVVLAIIIGATVFARRSLIAPQFARQAGTVAILLIACGTCGHATGQAAELPAASDILAGIRQRESLVKDVRMRVSTRLQQTAAYFESDLSPRRRHRGAAIPQGLKTQDAIYELLERQPCRAWSEIGPDGSVRSMSAFNGSMLAQGSASRRESVRSASSRPNPIPFPSPDSLMSIEGTSTSLIDLLENQKLTSISQREVDSETLIDFTITQTVNEVASAADMTASFVNKDATNSSVSATHRYDVTVNASRHYWPIRVNYEFSSSLIDAVLVRTETTTEGWIDAGPLVYPRRIKQISHRAVPMPNDRPAPSEVSIKPPTLEQLSTHETEILEIAVNSELPDSVFAPTFPVGTIFYDLDRQLHEVTADGTERLYHPKPKGLRGTVFSYHLIWMSVAMIWLWRQKAAR